MLANVRNGLGFGGVDTGDSFVPVTGSPDQRGLPDDICAETKALIEDGKWPLGDHSFHYLTIGELMAYDLSRSNKHRGSIWVRRPGQEDDALDSYSYGDWLNACKKAGRLVPPENYAGWVSGGNVHNISVEGANRILQGHRPLNKQLVNSRFPLLDPYRKGISATSVDPDAEMDERDFEKGKFYTEIEWDETYQDSMGESFLGTMARMANLIVQDEKVTKLLRKAESLKEGEDYSWRWSPEVFVCYSKAYKILPKKHPGYGNVRAVFGFDS